jgi:hypothetical protein
MAAHKYARAFVPTAEDCRRIIVTEHTYGQRAFCQRAHDGFLFGIVSSAEDGGAYANAGAAACDGLLKVATHAHAQLQGLRGHA